MPATPFSCSFFVSQPRFNYYITPIFRSLTYQLSSSPFQFNAKSSTVRFHCALSQAAETESPSGGRSGALTPAPPVTGEVQKIDVNPPKGTRDFPPEEMRLRNWLFNNFKEVLDFRLELINGKMIRFTFKLHYFILINGMMI
jgi:histidyl-tRNA synthetase